MTYHVLPARFDEESRLAALRALALLDGGTDPAFQALVALAAEALDCPTAMLNLVDHRRQWVLARNDAGMIECPREHAFCDHTIRRRGPLVVNDARIDPRFAVNPLVTAAGGIRFYAGMPIHAPGPTGEREPIGALCVIDSAPRSLDAEGRDKLAHFATLAEALIDARATALRAERQASDLARQHRVFGQAERMAKVGSWRLSLEDERITWSDGVYRIHEIAPGVDPGLASALDHYPPEARARVTEALRRTIATGESFDLEADFVTATGAWRRVRSQGEREDRDGRPVAVVGVFQDITDHHLLETSLRRGAETDPLTGLANRVAFERALNGAMSAARASGAPLLLALIDLDGFKGINDRLGHAAGDDVLRGVGAALGADWLAGSHAARLGGDEFALIVTDARLAADPGALERGLDAALRIAAGDGFSSGSVGIAALDATCVTTRDFATRADARLYAAKRARYASGEGRCRRAG